MFKATVAATVRLPLDRLQQHELEILMETFSIVPPAQPHIPGGNDQPVFCAAHQKDGKLLLPRFSAFKELTKDDSLSRFELDFQVENGKNVPAMNFQGSLDPSRHQPEAAAALNDWITDNHENKIGAGGIFVMPPGSGKTAMGCWLMGRLQVFTIIVVPTVPLMDQWVLRIKKFLPGVGVQTLQGSNAVLDPACPVTVTTLKSLSMCNYSEKFLSHPWGLMIVDEVHKACAPRLSQCMAALPKGPRHILGLSATPSRRDGFDKFLNWAFGNVIFQIKQESPGTMVTRIKTVGLDEKVFYINKSLNQLNTAKMINSLTEDHRRNDFLVKIVSAALKVGRKIVVLSTRCEHLKNLASSVENCVPDSKVVVFTGKTRVPVEAEYDDNGKCIKKRRFRRMTEDELSESDVIFATYQIFREGLDIVNRDTLVTATPVVQMEQAIGRIQRPCSEKQDPLVIDVWDYFSAFQNYGYSRNKFYKETNMTINNINGPLDNENEILRDVFNFL